MSVDDPTGRTVVITALPFDLCWVNAPVACDVGSDGSLTIAAGPRTDLFVDPGGSAPRLDAPAVVGRPSGDFRLSARVRVAFAATFDAGVLLLHAGERSWAKLCFEYSPRAEPTIVSVVTRGISDDCDSWVVDGRSVWLRVTRLGPAFAFHASTDGGSWRLVRHFALDTDVDPAVGFLAQSPTGEGCSVTFDEIRYSAERLIDLRDGT